MVDGVEQGFAISRWHGSERATKVAVVSRIKRRDPGGVYVVTYVVPDKNERLVRTSKSGTYAWCKS